MSLELYRAQINCAKAKGAVQCSAAGCGWWHPPGDACGLCASRQPGHVAPLIGPVVPRPFAAIDVDDVVKERDELRAKLAEAHGELMGEKSRCNDWIGMAKRFERERDEANVRVAWLERELKLEKAKNKRKGIL